MNIEWSQRILAELFQAGVREVVFCAGARNSPFISVLSKAGGIEKHSFFEERSASFFALGRARKTNRPVAIITTSGTAAAELLPAAIEAFHTGVPLLLITADRPKRLRGTGAPQAIDQTGLYAKFVDQEFDLEAGQSISVETWNRRKPLHLNICFDEPLVDANLEAFELSVVAGKKAPKNLGGDKEGAFQEAGFWGRSTFSETTSPEWASLRIAKFLRGGGTLLTVVGTLETASDREAVVELLLRLKSPVYLEGTSGLREDRRLSEIALKSGDRALAWALKRGYLNRVLRIGGVPTVRIWRDLEDPTSAVDVLSLTPLPFAGLSRGEMVCAEISSTLNLAVQELDQRVQLGLQSDGSLRLMTKDREIEQKLAHLFAAEPLAEPTLIRNISRLFSTQATVYIGNSLPIREWDLAAPRELTKPIAVQANRGVNGIDGQLSTFLGLAQAHRDNWALIGDLTTLYDLTSPWALAYLVDTSVRMVVINNGGGMIFSRLFHEPLFENRHAMSFAGWAKMWNLGYQKWEGLPSPSAQTELTLQDAQVIELCPDPQATERFWQAYESWWT